MVERKVKKRTRKTSPKRTRKTSPKRTRKNSPKRTRKTSPKRTRKTSPKRTRKTSPKRTRKTSPRRKRKTRSKRLNPSPRGIYNRILNRLYGGDRQTGYLDPGVISGRTEAYEARVAAEAARDELVERKATEIKDIYYGVFLHSKYNNDIANFIGKKQTQRFLLNEFHNKMITRISEEQVTEQPIAGFSLQESNRAKVAGLDMLIDMIKQQYEL